MPLSKGSKELLFLPRKSNQKALATLKIKKIGLGSRKSLLCTPPSASPKAQTRITFTFASSRFSDYFSRWRKLKRDFLAKFSDKRVKLKK